MMMHTQIFQDIISDQKSPTQYRIMSSFLIQKTQTLYFTFMFNDFSTLNNTLDSF